MIRRLILACGEDSIQKRRMNKILFSLIPLAFFALWTSYAFGQTPGRPGDSRKFKLSPVAKISSAEKPTMDGRRLTTDLLIDGKLPKDGWRSTWTAWYKVNPSFVVDLGEEKRIGIVRIFFQPWDRIDELAEIKVEVSRDGESFVDFNEYEGFVADRGKGAWAEIDLRAVKARYFRLSPKFQGGGHLWGEVEFWEIVK